MDDYSAAKSLALFAQRAISTPVAPQPSTKTTTTTTTTTITTVTSKPSRLLNDSESPSAANDPSTTNTPTMTLKWSNYVTFTDDLAKAKCNLCGRVSVVHEGRMRSHFLGGDPHVKTCVNVTPELQLELRTLYQEETLKRKRGVGSIIATSSLQSSASSYEEKKPRRGEESEDDTAGDDDDPSDSSDSDDPDDSSDSSSIQSSTSVPQNQSLSQSGSSSSNSKNPPPRCSKYHHPADALRSGGGSIPCPTKQINDGEPLTNWYPVNFQPRMGFARGLPTPKRPWFGNVAVSSAENKAQCLLCGRLSKNNIARLKAHFYGGDRHVAQCSAVLAAKEKFHEVFRSEDDLMPFSAAAQYRRQQDLIQRYEDYEQQQQGDKAEGISSILTQTKAVDDIVNNFVEASEHTEKDKISHNSDAFRDMVRQLSGKNDWVYSS